MYLPLCEGIFFDKGKVLADNLLDLVPYIVSSFIEMPARTRKRKASEEDDATPEVIPAANKTSRTSKRSSKTKTSSRNGRSRATENPDPVRVSKSSKSTTATVSNAKRDIRRKADELLYRIETRSANEELSCRVEDGPSNLGSGPTATESKTTPHQKDVIDLEHDSIRQSSNAIYRQSYEHLQGLQETIEDYRRLNNAKANLTKPTEVEQWNHDSTNIAQVNKRALEIAIDGLHGNVLGEKNANFHRSPAPSADDEVDQAAKRWLQAGVPIREDTWGDAAREVLSVLSGIAKILS
ncbi:hypothetical protein TRIATDRAFT_89713 [Trichoderma atroviride IMI 206040]|uniref:Uncharacterized protein n=1 Tax=Hypocrea atroviridis (strain ATCC 20476 / IMI 206040) TaxID=452589 RepID=G9NSC5_HYPAI|nr:uncharacterized protein TRIATDRAFT_89713 [Trichoderma atroviride IMI 206040]EHK46326.1 hypothetical protein TRIATDRAFT_89713 [Trichoderma atroviride IMI 206040]